MAGSAVGKSTCVTWEFPTVIFSSITPNPYTDRAHVVFAKTRFGGHCGAYHRRGRGGVVHAARIRHHRVRRFAGPAHAQRRFGCLLLERDPATARTYLL